MGRTLDYSKLGRAPGRFIPVAPYLNYERLSWEPCDESDVIFEDSGSDEIIL